MSSTDQCILLVENDPDLLRAVARRLRIANYRVFTAAGPEEARRCLQQEIVHLAIIDIRATNDRSETDRSGFVLARELPTNIPVLFHTAHDTKEHIREALGEIGADDIIAKEDPDAPAQLLRRVQAMFSDSVAVNFNLTLTSNVDLDQLAMRIGDTNNHGAIEADAKSAALSSAVSRSDKTNGPPEKNAPDSARESMMVRPSGADIDLLVRRLLPEALTVDLAPLLSSELQRSHSHSGAILLRVHETREEGRPVPMVLKIGATEMITDEAERYRKLQPFLGGQRLARLEDEACSRQVGGLLYTLVGAQEWESIDVLAAHLQRDRPEKLQSLLNRFLTQTFGAIFQEAQPTTVDLTSHYTNALGLTVEKLSRSLGDWYPTAQTADMLSFVGLAEALPNPVTWAVDNDHFRSWGEIATYTVLCHGDLHCRNILVDLEENCWLIDFGRAGRSHILRDFVELETDLRLQFVPGEKPAAILHFEEALSSSDFWKIPDMIPGLAPQLQRAYQLIKSVRLSAHELTVGKAETMEYQQALFWHLLNAVRLRALSQAKKEYMLLAGGVLSRSLDH